MADFDDDAPLELLWQELRESPLWQRVELLMLEKRDRMVALMVTDRPKAGEESGIALARKERMLGYIEAVNAILKAPADQQEKARKARIG